MPSSASWFSFGADSASCFAYASTGTASSAQRCCCQSAPSVSKQQQYRKARAQSQREVIGGTVNEHREGRNRRQLRSRGADESAASHCRVLGRVVWPVPTGRT